MAYLFSGLLNWLRGLFFAKHLEVTIVGLQVSSSNSSWLKASSVDFLPFQASGKTRYVAFSKPDKSGNNVNELVNLPCACAQRDRSLVNVLGANQFSEDVVPTVAFNLRQVRKGNVVMKIWDVAVSTNSAGDDGQSNL